MFRKMLMCQPKYFDVIHFQLNKHMVMKRPVDKVLAKEQWQNLVTKIVGNNVKLSFIEPKNDLVDMVFSANGGLTYKNKVIVSNFDAVPREEESLHYIEYFGKQDYKVLFPPDNIKFEGAGDALFSHNKKYLWNGHGFRTDTKAFSYLQDVFKNDDLKVISLKLVDPSFYHLDTCFCPLSEDVVMIYQPAFDNESINKIESHFDESNIIKVSSEDAKNFACNSIYSDVDGKKSIIGHKYSPELRQLLERRGYFVQENNMSEFLLSGGSTKCSVLELD